MDAEDVEAEMFGEIWRWMEASGPLANLIQIGTFIGAIVLATYAWFRNRLRDSGVVIARLEADLATRTAQLDKSRSRQRELEATCGEVRERLAETALASVIREAEDGNSRKAHMLARNWLDQEGEPIAAILRREAEWATVHAVGEAHEAGLAAAQAFATAAHAVWLRDQETADLAQEIARCRSASGTDRPWPLPEALAAIEAIEDQQRLSGRLVDFAAELEREAGAMGVRAHFRTAMLQITRVVEIYRRTLGARAPSTLQARRFKVLLSLWLGHCQEHLQEIQDICSVCMARHGPRHPDTLTSRYLLARLLASLGRSAEALPIIEDVAKKQADSDEIGPRHPETLVSRYVLAHLLDRLGRPAEALPIIQDVTQKQADEFGPRHPDTLRSRNVLAQVLEGLGQAVEALPIIQDVDRKQADSAEIGPRHPDTLRNRSLLAQMLDGLSRSAEALPIIEDVARKQADSAEIGPGHRNTLKSRRILAQVLLSLGRTTEALTLIEAVARTQAESPQFGPQHPETVLSQALLECIRKAVPSATDAA